MNLNQITGNALTVINPYTYGTLKRSVGYTTTPSGDRVPSYEIIPKVPFKVQALSNDEIRQLDGLNIQGNKQAVYLNGSWAGIVRADQKGGDLLVFGGEVWLAAIVLEDWPKWTKLAIVLQNRVIVLASGNVSIEFSVIDGS